MQFVGWVEQSETHRHAEWSTGMAPMTLRTPRWVSLRSTHPVEFELSVRPLKPSSPAVWDISFNASKVTNKILKLPENGEDNNRIGGIYAWNPGINDYAWLGGLQEGGKLGELYMYQQIGVYVSDVEAAAGPEDLISGVQKLGGDAKWADIDANGVIDGRDRVYAGNIYPTWTGGLTNSLNYKNFDFYLRLDYTTGHTIYNFSNLFYGAQLQGDNGLSTDLLRSWQKAGDVTDVPKLYWGDPRLNHYRGNESSSRYYETGNFLAIREITLAYTFAGQYLERAKIKNARLSISLNNLHYFTNSRTKSLNPEEGGTDDGRYAMPRNFIVSVKIGL